VHPGANAKEGALDFGDDRRRSLRALSAAAAALRLFENRLALHDDAFGNALRSKVSPEQLLRLLSAANHN